METLKAENKQLKRKIINLENENKFLSKEIKKNQEIITNLQGTLSKKEKENQAAKIENEELRKKLKDNRIDFYD